MSEEEIPVEELAKDLKGKTLRVYWYMLRHPVPMTAREIQRGAHLSSPSLSMHHLERLKQFGLVNKDVHGQYTIKRDVRFGLLDQFIGRGRLMVPRYLFYATFYTSLTAALATVFLQFGDWYSLVLLGMLGSVCILLWLEALRIWREQPFPEGD
ncbi:MAG: helix-turn-helix transcriptional regulator [Candidatus Thorarchaeota archaeon]|nr:MAG: helix-turn-helix transcriptional regulator [Candidatus Thorarchaeota archaeon]